MKVAVVCWADETWQLYSVEKICTTASAVEKYFEDYYPDNKHNVVIGDDSDFSNPDDPKLIPIENSGIFKNGYEWIQNYLDNDSLGVIKAEIRYPKNGQLKQRFVIQLRNVH